MNCSNCGKELKEGAKFCGHCGEKVKIKKEESKKNISENEQGNKKIIKISLKQKLLFLGILILIIITILAILLKKNNVNKLTISSNEGESETNIIDTYELNPIGFYKNKNILEEKYNENGDLIYCKYVQGNDTKEDYFKYEYDTKNRVTQIIYNDNVGTLNIEYQQDIISKITTDYDFQKTEYVFINTLDGNTLIRKYITIHQSLARSGNNKR